MADFTIPELASRFRTIDGEFTDLKRDGAIRRQQVSSLTSTVSTSTAVPSDVTGVSASESGYVIDGNVYSEVTVTYTAPNPLGSFAGVYFVVKNYRGSSELVKEGEHTFGGAAGTSTSFKVTLQRTNETITVYLVSKNSFGVSKTDWSTAPSTTVLLDGNASAPTAPTGLASISNNLGIALTWNANAESNIQGYRVYRGTTNVFGSATLLSSLSVPRTTSPQFQDASTNLVTIYYYWVTAINSTGQESVASSSVTAIPGGGGSISLSVSGSFGYTTTTTSATIYWDGTNASTLFSIKTADGTVKSISGSSATITALTNGHSYKFYPYYDISLDAMGFSSVAGSTGSPAYAYDTASATSAQLSAAVAGQIINGRVAVANGSFTLTTGGGSGGGNLGGDGCIAPWMGVDTPSGHKLISELVEGDQVSTPQGWTTVTKLRRPLQTVLYKIYLSALKAPFECSPSHPVAVADGRWRRADCLLVGDLVETRDGIQEVLSVEMVEFPYESILPSCDPYHEFYCHEVLTHNIIMLK